MSWSPRGTYLATFHRLWVQLWGGPSWTKLLKLAHGGVKLIDFSPNEKFVVTWSPESDQSEVGTPPPRSRRLVRRCHRNRTLHGWWSMRRRRSYRAGGGALH